jgi:hypothetical protein
MDQQLVIKLTAGDGTGVPVGLVESPPILYSNLKALFPTVTFSDIATPSETEPYWYGVYEWANPPAEEDVPHTKSIDDGVLAKGEDGIWRRTYPLKDATPEEIAQRTYEKVEFVRDDRTRLLRQCDFTQLPDAPDNVKQNMQAWVDYRQALRDIPAQEGFPWNVTYPVKP